ncbi:SRPBCC family protein [Dictyobacter alpinus]|nr:SRPBCC family protein [Dictyobacter alpinus]
MAVIRLETFIQAPVERCFDLSLNVDEHSKSVANTHEHPVAGVMSGAMKLGDTVTWEATHFGIRQHLTSEITVYKRPTRFTDEMTKGVFYEMKHHHEFVEQQGGTLMIDDFRFQAPMGIFGRLAEVLFLTQYMKKQLVTRNAYLKQTAEAEVVKAS